MKKHLIAAAVAAAVAVPAAAQVTVSGVLDTGFGAVNDGSSSYSGSVNNILSTSGIRFSGTEDLGGGLKASFALLQELDPSGGVYRNREVLDGPNTKTTTNGSQTDRFHNLFVSLEGGFGTVTLGKQQALARNAGGVGTIIGNVGLSGSYGSVSSRVLGDAVNDAVSYTTPTINGFRAQVLRGSRQANVYTAGLAETDDAAATATKQQTVALGATYTQGPLALGIGSLRREASASADTKTQVLGASYDLGMARVGLVYSEYDPTDATSGDQFETTVLNVAVPMGKTTLIGAWHNAERETGANESSTGIVLGATYAFSKRTTGYFVYSRVSNDASADYSISGMNTVGSEGADPKTTSIGIRHSF